MAKKKKTKPGARHIIIFVRHSLTRLFRYLLLATLIIWVIWWTAPYSPGPFRPPNDKYLAWAGTGLFILMMLVFLVRHRGFVQARSNHVLLALPLFRLKIPYTNIENMRMAQFKDLYEQKKLSWSQKRFLTPYMIHTVSVIHLHNFPVSEGLLRFFLPSYIFLPKEKGRGFVIFTDQYLEFNTEVDSRLNEYKAVGKTRPVGKEEQAFYDGYFDLIDD